MRQQPDAEGNVSVNFDKVEVDESLDTSSTNPVQNKAVAAKMFIVVLCLHWEFRLI